MLVLRGFSVAPRRRSALLQNLNTFTLLPSHEAQSGAEGGAKDRAIDPAGCRLVSRLRLGSNLAELPKRAPWYRRTSRFEEWLPGAPIRLAMEARLQSTGTPCRACIAVVMAFPMRGICGGMAAKPSTSWNTGGPVPIGLG